MRSHFWTNQYFTKYGSLLLAIAALVLIGCTPDPAQTEVSQAAPQPSKPLDGDVFVDSSQTLEWDWSPGLGENEAFVVRLWLEDRPDDYREVWASEPTLNVQEAIDSFATSVGVFYWQVAVIKVSQENGFEGLVSEWSSPSRLQRVVHISPTSLAASMRSDAARYVTSQGYDTATEIIDGAREFIHSNSTDEYGQEPGLPDRSDTLQQMYEYSQGRAEIAKVYCDGQSTAMLTLLLELGIDSRLIFLYGGSQESIVEHTLLEVFNPDTLRWELQDPYHNYYVADENGERISIERAVFGSLNTLSACTAENACKDDSEWFASYLQAFRYGYTNEMWVNPDRFDFSKRFADEGGLNLAEYLTNGDPRNMTFRFDVERP